MIRSVNTELLTENIKEMCIQANHYLAPDNCQMLCRDCNLKKGAQ